MSSDRFTRRIALLALLGLAGCGFAPVYGDGKVARGAYALKTGDSIMAFHLRGQLADRLGDPVAPQFTLEASVSTSQRAAAITEGGDTSRFNVVGRANWILTDTATDRKIDEGRVAAFTSYSATGSTVATQAAQDDARARLAVMLADMIVTRVMIATPDAKP
ncbi:MAG: LPS assembly lipoprotein LptE [Yoonia sp.]|uniref:LPS assembly lipoprotein LptE n=1 Tax=Yoonia sp. TaxID=2212373 RepID=UPI003EF8DE8D